MIKPVMSSNMLGPLGLGPSPAAPSSERAPIEPEPSEQSDLQDSSDRFDRKEEARDPSRNVLGSAVNGSGRGSNSRERSESSTREETFKKSLRTAISEKKPKSEPVGAKEDVSAVTQSQAAAGQVSANAQVGGPALAAPVATAKVVDGAVPKVPILFDGVDASADEVLDTPGEVSAVIRFMQSMEDEFGIDPRKLIGAMASVQAQVSQTAPQGLPIQVMGLQTQNQFFKELGLKGTEVRRAEFLYQTMLKEMAQDSMAGTVKDAGKQVDVALLSPNQIRRQEMGKSVDQMQKTFFMGERPAYGKIADSSQVPSSMEDASVAKNFNPDTQKKSAMGKSAGAAAAIGAAGNGTAAGVETKGMQATNSMDFWNQALAPSQAAGSVASADAFGDTAIESGATKTAQATSGAADMGLSGLSSLTASLLTGSGTSADSGDSDSMGQGSESGRPMDSATSDRGADGTARTGVESFASQFDVAKSAPLGGSLAATSPTATDRPEDVMNVRSLIQSAQVLLRQGGGEMKVQMNPEGLGQVDLKVKVTDGKVDVQILAETADTKRLLEKNITELRASLTGQKLDVADLKVDMAKTPDKESNSNSNSDFNREQARQFLGQFRDERESMRGGMFELPSMRQYKQSKASTIQPVEASSESKPAAKGSSRLNVVV